jgi:hypothetical protein
VRTGLVYILNIDHKSRKTFERWSRSLQACDSSHTSGMHTDNKTEKHKIEFRRRRKMWSPRRELTKQLMSVEVKWSLVTVPNVQETSRPFGFVQHLSSTA